MRNIEQKISPLISNMFPSFYQEDGQNFITFIEAYYEWLEQNFQLIDLVDNTGFSVGQTIRQDSVTGQIVAFVDKSLLIKVDGLETFKCFNVCSEFIPVSTVDIEGNTFSTYITKGGSTKRLGPIFFSRNLPNIRDIDKTIDLFVVQFKEKYLKDIEFDIESNKQLLVKNSLDLYRAKGTERAIDLFFRLIYGVNAETYYPGDDLFRLSDAVWYKPQYIEINNNSVDRAITLVGKQITGVTSGATAFVERYVKRHVRNSISHVLYVSSIKGTFIAEELLKDSTGIFPDSPRIIGSLYNTRIITKSENFKVGDDVLLSSVTGTGAIGRVSSVEPGDGRVDFSLINSGYGYTVNTGEYNNLASRTKTSDKFLTLANVQVGQYVSNVVIKTAGSGYSNSDSIRFKGQHNDARGKIITNNAGAVKKVVMDEGGSGFFPVIVNGADLTTKIDINSDTGLGAFITPVFSYPEKYFQMLESVTQYVYTLTYDGPLDSRFTLGCDIYCRTGSYPGKLIGINSIDNTVDIFLYYKNHRIPGPPDSNIYLAADPTAIIVVTSSEEKIVTGEVIFIANTGTIKLDIPTGNYKDFAIGSFVYQVDDNNNVVGGGNITANKDLKLDGGVIDIANIDGIFFNDKDLYVKDSESYAKFKEISFEIAISNTQGTFFDSYLPGLYSNVSSVVADIQYSTTGSDASFAIGSLDNIETVRLNTDLLTNTRILNNYINDTSYGFSKSGSAGLDDYLFKAFKFENFNIGSINTITEINPGVGYTRDPVTFSYQPYIVGYQHKDYIMNIIDGTSSFVVGEVVCQIIPKDYLRLGVASTSAFEQNEKLVISNTSASTIGTLVSIPSANTLIVGNMANKVKSPTKVRRYIASSDTNILGSNTYTANTIAKGIIKGFAGDEIYVKRIQFENEFVTNSLLAGTQSGATANLVNILQDDAALPIGLNGSVLADAIIADGTVTGIQVIDSGFGYRTDQQLTYTSSDGLRSGTATAIDNGVGVGSGYYKTSKGFVSNISKLHDGDYYQEYSYDIISRIPIDKYSDMFKKVMHTAGTRFFGSVLVDTLANNYISLADSEIIVSNTSPFVIQDRFVFNVKDRNKLYVEIRD